MAIGGNVAVIILLFLDVTCVAEPWTQMVSSELTKPK